MMIILNKQVRVGKVNMSSFNVALTFNMSFNDFQDKVRLDALNINLKLLAEVSGLITP